MSIALGILSFAIMIGFILFVDGFDAIASIVSSMKLGFLSLGVCFMIVYWLCETMGLHVSLKTLGCKTDFMSSLRVSMLGQFFNCVTPFASGGQPLQIYYLSTYGVPVGVSACALIAKFVVYQSVLTVYTLVLILLKLNFFVSNIAGFYLLTIIGFVANLIIMIILICTAFFKAPTRFVIDSLYELLIKLFSAGKKTPARWRIRLVSRIEASRIHTDTWMEDFFESFKQIRTQYALFIKLILLTVLELTVYFLVPYAVYLGFGLKGADVVTFVAAQAFVLLVSSYFPMPGAVGAAEGSFYMFFKLFFPANFITSATFLWRIYTFGLPILFGGIFAYITPGGKLPAAQEVTPEVTPEAADGGDGA